MFAIGGNFTSPVTDFQPGAGAYNMSSTNSGVSQSAYMATFGLNLPDLAINLTNIEATNKGKVNEVNWSTAQEDAGDYFELERSADAATFNHIANIKAKGNNSRYTYIDESPLAGINYYRLRMVSPNGQITYSKTVIAFVKGGGTTVSVYPNPTKSILYVNGLNGTTTYRIVDITGRQLINGKVIATTGNTFSINTAALVPGTYILQYQDEIENKAVRFVKQ